MIIEMYALTILSFEIKDGLPSEGGGLLVYISKDVLIFAVMILNKVRLNLYGWK